MNAAIGGADVRPSKSRRSAPDADAVMVGTPVSMIAAAHGGILPWPSADVERRVGR